MTSRDLLRAGICTVRGSDRWTAIVGGRVAIDAFFRAHVGVAAGAACSSRAHVGVERRDSTRGGIMGSASVAGPA